MGIYIKITTMNLVKKLTQLFIGAFDYGNYTQIEDDGTVVNHGNATVWDDLRGSLIARRLEATNGRLQYNWNQNAIIMQNNGDPTKNADRLMFNFQHPHGAKQAVYGGVDSEQHLHMHYEQTSTNILEFQVDYRVQRNGEAKTTSWTTLTFDSTDNVFPYVSGTLNQIINLGVIPVPHPSLSATVQYRLTRIDGTAGDINAIFVDAHIEYNMNGSRQQFIK